MGVQPIFFSHDTTSISALTTIFSPYYKLSASGQYVVRSDHPSDVVKIDQNHFLMKQFRETDSGSRIFEIEQNFRAIKECIYILNNKIRVSSGH